MANKCKCLLFSILSATINVVLLYSLFPNNSLAGHINLIIILGVISLLSAIGGIYSGIPHFDEDTGKKEPTSPIKRASFLLSFVNLIVVIGLTPIVFLAWEVNDLPKIINIFSSLFS